jgi:poly(ADP-ribose) glycohydrolase ARH3
VTHTHPEAIDGAVLVTTTCILLARDGPERPAVDAVRAACRYLDESPVRRAVEVLLAAADDPPKLIEMAAAIGTGVTARESVPAAIAALLSASDHLDVTLNAVLLGGDTDTIAAMAGAMSAARHGPDGLSDRQLARLEARERLWELATALGRG